MYPQFDLICFLYRLTLVLSCPMHFKNYPHDTQTCNLEIESSKYLLFMLLIYLYMHLFVNVDCRFVSILSSVPTISHSHLFFQKYGTCVSTCMYVWALKWKHSATKNVGRVILAQLPQSRLISMYFEVFLCSPNPYRGPHRNFFSKSIDFSIWGKQLPKIALF